VQRLECCIKFGSEGADKACGYVRPSLVHCASPAQQTHNQYRHMQSQAPHNQFRHMQESRHQARHIAQKLTHTNLAASTHADAAALGVAIAIVTWISRRYRLRTKCETVQKCQGSALCEACQKNHCDR